MRAAVPSSAPCSAPASAPTERIDYVRLRPGADGWAPAAIERILDESVGGVHGSDHLGVAATVTR